MSKVTVRACLSPSRGALSSLNHRLTHLTSRMSPLWVFCLSVFNSLLPVHQFNIRKDREISVCASLSSTGIQDSLSEYSDDKMTARADKLSQRTEPHTQPAALIRLPFLIIQVVWQRTRGWKKGDKQWIPETKERPSEVWQKTERRVTKGQTLAGSEKTTSEKWRLNHYHPCDLSPIILKVWRHLETVQHLQS